MEKHQPANFNKTDYQTLLITYISLYLALIIHGHAESLSGPYSRSWSKTKTLEELDFWGTLTGFHPASLVTKHLALKSPKPKCQKSVVLHRNLKLNGISPKNRQLKLLCPFPNINCPLLFFKRYECCQGFHYKVGESGASCNSFFFQIPVASRIQHDQKFFSFFRLPKVTL